MNMKTKVAVISIIVEDKENIPKLNKILTDHREFIIGRMGIPYHARRVDIISIVIDAGENTINNMVGEIEKLEGIYPKVAYSNL